MNTLELTHSQQVLFALLKLALWNTVPDKALFEKADDAVWNEVYRLSGEQGIKAIVFDGVMLLPKELHPSRSIKLAWAINVESLECRYEREVAAASEIAGIFAKNDIKMLLFKGVGLAQYYPVPKHREFGDIDIYLFGKQAEGDRLLVQAGAVKEKHNRDVHAKLHYQGITVENHKYLLEKSRFHDAALLEAHLMKTLADNEPFSQHLINTAIFPPPNFNVLFIACHIYEHFFVEPLVLRHLCDWALFLKTHKGTIDFDTFRRIIAEAGFLKIADAFTALTVKYLDLNPEFAPPFDNNPALEDRMMQELFNPLTFPTAEKRSLLKTVRHKLKVLRSCKWKYDELLYPNLFWKFTGAYIFFYITHPAHFVKLRK